MEGYIEPEDLFPSYEKFSYYDYNADREIIKHSATFDEIISTARRPLLPVEIHPDETLDKGGNLLINGDDLLVLLNPKMNKFQNKVMFVYLDEYAMGRSSDSDSIKAFLKPKLKAAKDLLSEEGSIWINCFNSVSHHIRAFCDEVFGEFNYITTITWQRNKTGPSLDSKISETSEIFIVYAKNYDSCKFNKLEITEDIKNRYSNPDNDPRGSWRPMTLTQHWPDLRVLADRIYPIFSPSHKEFHPGEKKIWRYSKEKIEELKTENRIWFGKDGNSNPQLKVYLSESGGLTPVTLWFSEEVGDFKEAAREAKEFNSDIVHGSKPERLIQRILTIATDVRDIVLTYSAGNGTVLAVAHKMNRKWIGIEKSDAIDTHIIPRLEKVISGQDANGITNAVFWKGGGSYGYYKLGESQEKSIDSPTLKKVDIQFKPVRWYINFIYELISKRNEIDINPSFNVDILWDERLESQFIETMLLRIPIQPFYIAKNEDGTYQVIDGKQRLITLKKFINNELCLQSLEYLKELEGRYFSDQEKKTGIDRQFQRKILQTPVEVYILDRNYSEEFRYNLYRRLNTSRAILEPK